MTQLLHQFSKFTIIHVDDVVIYSKTKDEHDENLRKVLKCINDAI